MSRLPILTFKEFSKILSKLGYFEVRQKGSHVIFENTKGNTITVPKHPGKTLGKGLMRKYIYDLNMSVEEFVVFLKSK
jgi:predicted RNA binding protein YcfA (HicA-like mRNA interferase family)